ncbi:cleavage induced hypothetical protein [Plasmopara halstedii]|uniref:PX domain-containing protein n=1 Tax=Plasmopara halstedii TaxID=4781 RepID=A0A0N7L884_PLAHL|nr:cleavage induced hypothetical protein [Plasmopara halstedii]CEG49163.1 cleavage induced hypothetical protein [Plasmopara halstedii]|eukprot:XP_024585532.1 cleavage induced hypothetical protein [Plasmopara halstedii]
MNPTSRYAYSRNGDLGRVDEKCLVRVQIPTVDLSDVGKVRYHVRITNIRSGQAWEAPRRFSEFLQLRNELIEFFLKTDKKCPGCCNYEKVLNLFEFPRKHVFTSVTHVVINYRKKALCNFIALLASHTFTTTPKCPTCSGFPFTSVRDWLTTGIEIDVNANSVGSISIEAIRDSIKVKDFTNYHPVSNAMPVDQEGRFVGSIAPIPFAVNVNPTNQTDIRRLNPSHRQPERITQKKCIKSQLCHSDDPLSSVPLSPFCVDKCLTPTQAHGAPLHVQASYQGGVDNKSDEKLDSPNLEIRLQQAQVAFEPSNSDGLHICQSKTVEKDRIETSRSSIDDNGEPSSVQHRSASIIDTNVVDIEDDEGLNMDFMNVVSVVPIAIE